MARGRRMKRDVGRTDFADERVSTVMEVQGWAVCCCWVVIICRVGDWCEEMGGDGGTWGEMRRVSRVRRVRVREREFGVPMDGMMD